MHKTPNLLTDQQMREYIVNGYVTVQTDFPAEFHAQIYRQALDIFERGPNPWNDIYPMIPDLAHVFAHPAVDGVLTSILGPGYIMHPHRHCHFNQPGSAAQSQHKDSYEEDENVRHHRTRWAMAFYYPQAITPDMGPSAIQPGTQYYNLRATAKDQPELALTGPAGTVAIIHYDLWHRALANSSNSARFMMKFLFCRMEEPKQPVWQSQRSEWISASPADDLRTYRHEALWQQMWHWHMGTTHQVANGNAATDTDLLSPSVADLHAPSERRQLDAAYALGAMGKTAVSTLMEVLVAEVEAKSEENLRQQHTNPSELCTSHALAAIGEPAVLELIQALDDRRWGVRAAAADILGDMGHVAHSAIPALINALKDESEWVRRNATESLGTMGEKARSAVPALARVLTDAEEIDWVRHNAALALARIGSAAQEAVPALQQMMDHDNPYISGNSAIALARIGAA